MAISDQSRVKCTLQESLDVHMLEERTHEILSMYLPHGAFLEENFQWESQEHYSVERRIEHVDRVAGCIRTFLHLRLCQ